MKSMYTKKHLLEALKQANLPYSYTTLMAYEKKGIIPPPKTPAIYKDIGRVWRVYSKEEIQDIVKRVREHIKQKG